MLYCIQNRKTGNLKIREIGMKKLRYVVIGILTICLSALLFLCGCGETRSSSPNGLVFNKKYVRGAFGVYRENYFLFRTDGTGDYVRNFDPEYASAEHYTMHFKWFYADKDETAVVCFYDGADYDEATHKAPRLSDNTHFLVTVSECVLYATSSALTATFINEDYVDQLQNYNIE